MPIITDDLAIKRERHFKVTVAYIRILQICFHMVGKFKRERSSCCSKGPANKQGFVA